MRQQYEDGLRANRQEREGRQRKESQDRKNHDDYMNKLRQQGQQTYPYVQPPYVGPSDYGGSGRGQSKGGLGKAAVIVIGLIAAFAYFGSKSDHASPAPDPAPAVTAPAPEPAPVPRQEYRPAETAPEAAPAPEPAPSVYTPQPTPAPAQPADTPPAAASNYPPPAVPEAPAPLQLVQQVRPVYPPLARQARMQGTIRVILEIAPDGSVVDARPENGNPILAKAATDTARQWRYNSYAAVPGQPLRTTTADFTFNLDQ